MNAMSYGKPIITTPLGHLKLLVKNGINGYLCSNEKDMIDRIKSIDIEIAAKMGKESYNIAKQYSWEEYTDKTLDIYNKLLHIK